MGTDLVKEAASDPIPAFAGGQVPGDFREAIGRAVEDWLLRTPSPHTRRAYKHDLTQFLAHAGIPVVDDLDTRALVRHLRTRGVMRGVLSSVEKDATRLISKDAYLTDRDIRLWERLKTLRITEFFVATNSRNCSNGSSTVARLCALKRKQSNQLSW